MPKKVNSIEPSDEEQVKAWMSKPEPVVRIEIAKMTDNN